MAITFDLAERRNSKMRVAAQGPAGFGKTALLLLIARAFCGGDATKVFVIDSERKSVSKSFAAYTKDKKPACRIGQLDGKTVRDYIEAVRLAAQLGAEALVIDSFSHAWIEALAQVDRMGGNKFTNGWKTVSPLINELVDAILNFPGHVLCTMRTKAEYAMEIDEKGKAVPKKHGMAAVQRDGVDYEFDLIFDMTAGGGIVVAKSRIDSLPIGTTFTRPMFPGDTANANDVPKIITTLKAWLDEGAPIPARSECLERIAYADSLETLKGVVAAFIAAQKTAGKLDEGDLLLVRNAYASRGAFFTAQAAADAEVPE